MFNALDVRVCVRIAARMLREVAELLHRSGLAVEFAPAVKNTLAREGFSEEYGARELRRLIKRRIEDPLTDLILRDSLGTGDTLRVRLRSGRASIDVARAPKARRGGLVETA